MSDPQRDSTSPQEAIDLVALHATAAREPVKLWLLGVIMAVMFVGGMFLWANSGGFSSSVYDPARLVAGKGNGAPKPTPDPRMVSKRLYMQNCAVCHQPNGMGIPGTYPPLVGSEWVLGQEWHGDNHIVRIVLHGLEGPITVEGRSFNNVMTPWGGVLKDDQIAAILTYVRSEWGNSAPPISNEFVAQVREETRDRRAAWTQKELQEIPRQVSPPPLPEPTPIPSASPSPTQSPPAA